MNPFDWPGPPFLAFYMLLMVVTLIAVRHLRKLLESRASVPAGALTDPYRIAVLRGGKSELVRVAIVSLVDRGLLVEEERTLKTSDSGRQARPRRDVEQKLLELCTKPQHPAVLVQSGHFHAITSEYKRELRELDLLPSSGDYLVRSVLFFAVAALLVVVAFTKIDIAFSRGHSNVEFLAILCLIGVVVAVPVAFAGATAKGQQILEELRNVFQSLKVSMPQARSGGGTSELVMLAAVFGIAALPADAFPWTRRLFPDGTGGAGTSSSDSGGGSSCGSSSCGGGGGCGGCGSS